MSTGTGARWRAKCRERIHTNPDALIALVFFVREGMRLPQY